MTALMLIVHGAYGRDYSTWEEAIEDWNAGKEFKMLSGSYCSKRDIPLMKERGIKYVYFITGEAEILGSISLVGENGHTVASKFLQGKR